MDPLTAAIVDILGDFENHDDVRVYRNGEEGAVVMSQDGERTHLVELCADGAVVTSGLVRGR